MSIVLQSSNADHQPTSRPTRVLAIEIEHHGHHPSYIRNFAKTWAEYKIQGELKFLVSAQFLALHREEVDFVKSLGQAGLSIEQLQCPLPERGGPRRLIDYWTAWGEFCAVAKRWQACHGLLMYSDFFQLPVSFGKVSPCPLTAIYFRPTFHYRELAEYRPTVNARVKAIRKAWLMKRFLRAASVHRVFSLDQLAVDYMNTHMAGGASVEFLPDTFAPFEHGSEDIESMRLELGVEEGRTVLMLIGILDRRKGVVELLEACGRLPEEVAARICLVLVGRLAEDCRKDVNELVARLGPGSAAQVILRNQFVPEADVQVYYGVADVILATYQKHMGSSSALIRAGLAGKPVLASDYGLLGELVRRRKLGRTVDACDSQSLVDGIISCLEAWEGYFQPEKARQFYEENTPAQLAECLRRLTVSDHRSGIQPAAGKKVFQHS